MAAEVGDRAPDVTLTRDNSRTTVRLDELRGGRPLLVLFYPFAFSSTCTEEMCAVAEDYSAYDRLGAGVVGISVDSPYTNARFARDCGASFPFLSDFNRTATRAFDVYRDAHGELEGVSERAAFVIDANGTIRYRWVGEHPGVFPPLDEIRAAGAAAAGGGV